MSERFEQETETEARERPMRCVIALSSLLVQAKMLSDKMDHEDVLRARRLARAIIKADGGGASSIPFECQPRSFLSDRCRIRDRKSNRILSPQVC
jgi:hypothetical protein